jgi:hypothetical protein
MKYSKKWVLNTQPVLVAIEMTPASGRDALSAQEIIVFVPQDTGCAPPTSSSMLWLKLRRNSWATDFSSAFSRNLKLVLFVSQWVVLFK